MSVALALIAGIALGAFAAWRLAGIRATATLARVREETRREIRHWVDAAERARAEAERVTGEAAARLDGWRQGTADVISAMPLIQGHQDAQPGTQQHAQPDVTDRSRSAG